jgi:integrase
MVVLTENRRNLIRSNVKILTPAEVRALIQAIPKLDYKIMFKALLYSGMRYVEMQRFQEHPEWFDGQTIHISRLGKKKAKLKEREVHLSSAGKEVIFAFINLKKKLPEYSSWKDDLVRWAKDANISDFDKVGPKATRKTYESWLIMYFPHFAIQVTMSQGHTTTTAIQHYLNLSFTSQEKAEMKDFVEGWN